MTRATARLRHLMRNSSGATLPMGAAAILVLLALVGSAVDVSRGYMARTTLQSACDSAVLAGRRAMSKSNNYGRSEQGRANQMFAFNFPDNQFNASDVSFASEANDDGEVTGTAAADVPTIVMHLFGYDQFALEVACSAELQLASADVMFVLDTTGSMNCNPGETCGSSSEAANAKIRGLRAAVRDFHLTVSAAVQNDDETRIRYAFVPYSMTVNVRNLILDGSMPTSFIADRTLYQSREARFSATPSYIGTAGSPTTVIQTYSSAIHSQDCNEYANNNYPSSGSNPVNSGSAPGNTTQITYSLRDWTRTTGNGNNARGTCRRNQTTVITTYTTRYPWAGTWRYRPLTLDTSAFKSFSPVSLVTGISTSSAFAPTSGYIDVQTLATMSGTTGLSRTSHTWNGCIEERATTSGELDFDPVPSNATDLDINSAPDSEETRWKPYFGGAVFRRTTNYSSSVETTSDLSPVTEYCPSPMRLFTRIDTTDSTTVPAWLNTYLNNLRAVGGTYHDIGMIWGGRLGSPRGIFADIVDDEPERSVSRHIIFMTDGQMAPEVEFYSAYGLELYDNRVAPRYTSDSGLIPYHNARFLAACTAAKAEGYTIWVIGFSTSLTSEMRACSSAGRAYLSNNTAELQATFRFIASQVADLRLNR